MMDISVAMQPDGCFVAIDRNNYDVDCDHTGFFTKSPTGHGRTPLDAIVDLLDIVEPVTPNYCHLTGAICNCTVPVLCTGPRYARGD